MEKIDFNNQTFKGFEHGEDILVDTSVLLALLADYDPWHQTVLNLFNLYIFPDESVVLLYTNPTIINEVLHISTRSLTEFIKKFQIKYSVEDKIKNELFIENMLKVFVDEKIFQVLDGDTHSVIQQIELSKVFGAADATNISIANLYGTNFLTTDKRLADNMERHSEELANVKKVYFTTARHMTHRV